MTTTYEPGVDATRQTARIGARRSLPGIAIAAIGACGGWIVHERWPSVSPHVVAVVVGAFAANLGLLPRSATMGLRAAAKRVLRIGVALLGFRLSLGEMFDLGPRALLAVTVVVLATFTGTQWLGRRLGVPQGLSLLVAMGYSICGASAIAATEPFADSSDEEVAYAIGLVTLCGSLAIAVLPLVGTWIGLSSHDFGAWAGASVHDVGQVVAVASTRDDVAMTAAVVVKLTRVVLLAPLLALVAFRWRRERFSSAEARPDPMRRPTHPPLLPLFVALFLLAMAVRSSGVVPANVLHGIQQVETFAIAMGLVGLGSQVHLARLRRLGGRPLVLGLASWLLIGTVSLAAVAVIGQA